MTRWRFLHLGNGAPLETGLRILHRRACSAAPESWSITSIGSAMSKTTHELYVREHRVVASRQLTKLARDCRLFQEPVKTKTTGAASPCCLPAVRLVSYQLKA